MNLSAELRQDMRLHFTGITGPKPHEELQIISSKDFSWKLFHPVEKTAINGSFGTEDFNFYIKKEFKSFSSKVKTKSGALDDILIPAFNNSTPLDIFAKLSGITRTRNSP